MQVAERAAAAAIALSAWAVGRPILLSSIVGALTGLWSYRQQTKERVAAHIAWRWTQTHQGEDEEPYLAVQNSGNVPAYIVRSRILTGCLWRRFAHGYAFDYPKVTDGSYPLEIKAAGVDLFPVAKYRVDRLSEKAGRLNRFLSACGRDYLWIEITTL